MRLLVGEPLAPAVVASAAPPLLGHTGDARPRRTTDLNLPPSAMIAVVHRVGRGVARALWAIATVLAATALGILINIVTAEPLAGPLRWLQPGWRKWVALVICALASAAIGVLASRTGGTQAAAIQVKTKPQLQTRYDEASSQYRHPTPDASWVISHRVGLFNAPDAEPLRHVRVHLVGMSPLPRHLNGFDPVIPYAVPMLSDGDTSIGITLAPGREELCVLGYTSTGSDGSLNAGGFAPPDQRWRGLPWQLDADERYRLCYEVVCDDHEPAEFSIVLFADGCTLHCRLES